MKTVVIHKLDELDDATTPYPAHKTRDIKQKALNFLGLESDDNLHVSDAKKYRAKTNKIKRSNSKAQRRQNHAVERAAKDANNFN